MGGKILNAYSFKPPIRVEDDFSSTKVLRRKMGPRQKQCVELSLQYFDCEARAWWNGRGSEGKILKASVLVPTLSQPTHGGL